MPRFMLIHGSLALAAVLLLAACGGGGGGSGPPPPPQAATHLSVSAPTTATVGSAVSITVSALDAANQVVATYSGAVHFTSTDTQAVLPADSSLANGTANFSATLKTAGSQTITASDAANRSLTGTSNAISIKSGGTSPVPLINQPLTPDATPPGGAAFQLTLNGTGFVPGSTVRWNGSARATTVISSSRLTADILASDIASAQTAAVTVVNPGPGGGISNAALFQTTSPTTFASWSAPSAPAVGAQPSSVATADFNADGKQDLVVTNSGSSNLSILLGNGDGTFQTAVDYAAGTNPSSVAVGDFNGDGKLDLIVANAGSGNVSVLLGNGDGTFQAAVGYAAGTNPSSVAVGDFNGDGKLDLIVANAGSGNVSVLLGNGDGTFQAAVDYAVGSNPSSVAVGDFNGDGTLDLAVANADNIAIGSVSILLGNGNGSFKTAVNYPTGANSSSVAVGDFNGDGRLDLAVANGGTGNFSNGDVSILLGNGDGTFEAAVNYPTKWKSSFVAVGDFNGDGKLDLAVASISSDTRPSTLSALLGNGDGTFQAATDHAAGTIPSSIAVGDFNADGTLDLAVADQNGSTLAVLLSPPAGPNATLSSTSLAFGTQLVGTPSPGYTVILSNDGTAPLSITSVTTSAHFGETDTCASPLAAGASCSITVTFTPSVIGNQTGELSIVNGAPGSPNGVALSGAGTQVQLSPGYVLFSCHNQGCAPQNVTLTNTGATALSIGSIYTSGPGSNNHHDFNETNNCPASLGAGQTCTITVTLVGAIGMTYVGGLYVQDDGGGSPQIVAMRGTVSSL